MRLFRDLCTYSAVAVLALGLGACSQTPQKTERDDGVSTVKPKQPIAKQHGKKGSNETPQSVSYGGRGVGNYSAAALGGDWSTAVSVSASTISAAAGDNSFNDSGSGFSTTNLLPGMWIRVGGFVATANNRLWRIVSVTTSKIADSNVTAAKLGPNVLLGNNQAGAIILM